MVHHLRMSTLMVDTGGGEARLVVWSFDHAANAT